MTKNIIFGLGGLVVGAVGGFMVGKFYYKEKYERQAEEEIAEMREHYERKEHNLKTVTNMVYGAPKMPEDFVAHEPDSFRVDEPIDAAEAEHPEDDDEEFEDEEPDIDDANREYEHNKHKKPKIISVEEIGNLPPGTDSRTLFLYTYDDTITDEDDEEIEQPELLLGDCLDKYDFYDSDERVIFVMNYELSTCYEISKIDAAWGGR